MGKNRRYQQHEAKLVTKHQEFDAFSDCIFNVASFVTQTIDVDIKREMNCTFNNHNEI